jgi:Fur family ferric uptake transcriptional regulator
MTGTLKTRIDDHPTISQEELEEARALFSRHIRSVGLKHTAQRNIILETFLGTHDHLSSDQLLQLVRQHDPKVGLTTVYRTLKLLRDCGLASEVAFHDGVMRYEHQHKRRSHHHMVCTRCGASAEFFSPEVDKVEKEIGRRFHYETTRHTFQIYGICEKCRGQEREQERAAR